MLPEHCRFVFLNHKLNYNVAFIYLCSNISSVTLLLHDSVHINTHCFYTDDFCFVALVFMGFVTLVVYIYIWYDRYSQIVWKLENGLVWT